MPQNDEALATALDEAAETAELSAQEQQDAAEAARETADAVRAHEAGPHVSADRIRVVLHLLGQSAQRLSGAAGVVRRTWARTLSEDGLSIRQIGERLGVSHQRVSVLLSRHGHRAEVPGVTPTASPEA